MDAHRARQQIRRPAPGHVGFWLMTEGARGGNPEPLSYFKEVGFRMRNKHGCRESSSLRLWAGPPAHRLSPSLRQCRAEEAAAAVAGAPSPQPSSFLRRVASPATLQGPAWPQLSAFHSGAQSGGADHLGASLARGATPFLCCGPSSAQREHPL